MSTVAALRSTASSAEKGQGYLHWWLEVGKQREDPGTRSRLLLSQLPQGLLDFVRRLRTVCYRLGRRESSGVGVTHTWTGDALGGVLIKP